MINRVAKYICVVLVLNVVACVLLLAFATHRYGDLNGMRESLNKTCVDDNPYNKEESPRMWFIWEHTRRQSCIVSAQIESVQRSWRVLQRSFSNVVETVSDGTEINRIIIRKHREKKEKRKADQEEAQTMII